MTEIKKSGAFFRGRYEHLPAQYLRIGVRRLAQKVLVERLHRKNGGIYARKSCGEGHKLIAPEVELYGDRLFIAVLNVAFNGTYCYFGFNHITIFCQKYNFYSRAEFRDGTQSARAEILSARARSFTLFKALKIFFKTGRRRPRRPRRQDRPRRQGRQAGPRPRRRNRPLLRRIPRPLPPPRQALRQAPPR